MDLRQLRYFATIVECGSLNKAAERVFVAQPALSQQMAALEEELKVSLLIRSSHGVTPTGAGKVLYRHAIAVLRQIDTARQEVRLPGSSGETGLVAIGLPPTIASILALPLVHRVRERHRGIRLHLIENSGGHLLELLELGRLDMSVHFRESETPGIARQVLLDEAFFLVGDLPAGKSAADVCRMAELDGVPLVLPSAAHGVRLLVEKNFAAAKLELNVVADIDSFGTLVGAAASGIACTILPWSALPPGFAEHHSVRPLVEPGIRRPVSLCWLTTLPRTAAGLAVQQILTELVSELVEAKQWVGVSLRSAH